VTVFVPEGASSAKVAAMRASGADVRVHGTDGLDAELAARRVASASGMPYVSPYNDLAVVAGQGTIGVELRAQGPRLDAVVIAVGGGGLISGVGADLKTHWPGVEVIGAVPSNSPVMAASIRAGHVVEFVSLPTLSDGTAGGIERDAMTFAFCRALVDTWVEVPESEIAAALHHCVVREHVLVEGAAAVAVAGLWRRADVLHGKRVGVVLCGANISASTLCSALASVS
jgi:threonine dehydratase